MSTLTIPQVADVWTRNGGNPDRLVDAVSVAMAESGGRTDAHSAQGDYGLWQINQVNFHNLGLTPALADDPDHNAVAAITMSGNGTNWAEWCTAWANPQVDCGHGFLADPEPNSAAGSHIAAVAAVLLGAPGTAAVTDTSSGPPELAKLTVSAPGHPPDHQGAWHDLQDFFATVGPTAYNNLGTVEDSLRGHLK